MKNYNIKGIKRKETGKRNAATLRKEKNVPCVLYGGDRVIHFYTPQKTFFDLVYTPEVFSVKLDIEGEQIDAVVQEIQFHPVSDEIIHVDLLRVSKDKPVTVDIPIRLTGKSIGLINGGKLRQRRRKLKVKGLVRHIPNHLNVDITDVDIGDFIQIRNLSYDNLEILDPPKAMVAGVVSSKVIAKGMKEAIVEEEAGIEEAVEGEVITEEEEEKGEKEETPEEGPKSQTQES